MVKHIRRTLSNNCFTSSYGHAFRVVPLIFFFKGFLWEFFWGYFLEFKKKNSENFSRCPFTFWFRRFHINYFTSFFNNYFRRSTGTYPLIDSVRTLGEKVFLGVIPVIVPKVLFFFYNLNKKSSGNSCRYCSQTSIRSSSFFLEFSQRFSENTSRASFQFLSAIPFKISFSNAHRDLYESFLGCIWQFHCNFFQVIPSWFWP